MTRRDRRWLTDLLQRTTLAHWSRAARAAPTASLADLQRQRVSARALRVRLDELLAIADDRLALPRIGSSAMPTPPGTDWSWRPPLWREPLAVAGMAQVASPAPLGPEATIHHDCPLSEIAVRQVRNPEQDDVAAFGLAVDTFGFAGTFLSVVVELPHAAAEGLRRRHLMRLEIAAAMERPIGLVARLNVKHGPNVEQVVREIAPGPQRAMVEFDLAYTRLAEKRAEKMWLDLIFGSPAMNRIVLRDVTLARYPRAEL